jgi:hypothetical protein
MKKINDNFNASGDSESDNSIQHSSNSLTSSSRKTNVHVDTKYFLPGTRPYGRIQCKAFVIFSIYDA